MGPTGTDLAAGALSVATLGAAAAGALAGVPAGEGMPCLFRAVSGEPCPFCGLTHSVMALGDGDIGLSLALHPLGMAALALAVLVLVAVAVAFARRRRVGWRRGTVVAGGAVVVTAWTFTLIGGGAT